MELKELQTIRMDERLGASECLAISPAHWRSGDLVRVTTGLLAGGATFTASLLMIITLTHVIGQGGLMLAIGMVLMLASIVLTLLVGGRYFDPGERRLLSLRLEPDAWRFTLANWHRRQALLDEARTFDHALRIFHCLPERAGAEEVDQAAAESLQNRRERLITESVRYRADFERATVLDRGRVAFEIERRRKPTRPDKKALEDFHLEVCRLVALEETLSALPEETRAGATVDLSLFVATEQRRQALEQERERLLAKGLKPKRIPARKIKAGRADALLRSVT